MLSRRALCAFTLTACAVASATTIGAHDARAAWPPARGADMRDKTNWPNDYAARWNYASFLPEQQPGTPPYLSADKKLGASGMSIDKAWTFTVGRPDVRIAVLDSGIHWESRDLVNKVALNQGELRGEKRPKTESGGVCGGQGTLAGYDCNGDGLFTIADYANDPRMSPDVPGEKCFTDGDRTKLGADRKKGDQNRNCVLDPGDLIELFSDGVDDDANGYKDDIAGWDFFKDDNNPYDDTRYGHGTGEARDAAAEGNNGIDEIGVCPGCTFVPLRVGDSFITDVDDFAQATVYAADLGVKVVQEALGTINQTPFAKAAIDYAYTKGAVVVASMADENSRHHNMPAVANHTLTVHTVRYNGPNPNASSTFLNFDTCSNYGAHLSMSVSGTRCSSEATGRAAGIAGLLYSMAAQKGIELTAEEAIQIFRMQADDIDVEESRSPDPELSGRLYFSKAGWDQRFGYGRANAERMMKAIDELRIPPEVDITSPEWFTPIVAGRGPGQVAIAGRVSARRATSYDYRVEWAPGVEPDDTLFKPLVAEKTNVPGATVSGGTADAPLAALDPSQIDTTHPRDADSPRGENDRTITIRVRAIAHYPGYDVPGEARRAITITNEKNGGDKDLLPGFPLYLGTSLEASPKLADIDGDGLRDIVQLGSDGLVHVLSMRTGAPVEASGFPYRTRVVDGLAQDPGDPAVPSYLTAPAYAQSQTSGIVPSNIHEAIMSAPAIADLDGDGKQEIVFVSYPGTLYVIDSRGKDLPGWPKRMPLVPSCPLDPAVKAPEPCMDVRNGLARGLYASPVVVDMNKDGKKEIVQAAFDGKVHVFKVDGSPLDGFPVEVHHPLAARKNRIFTTPAVADVTGDGIPEIFTGSNEEIGGGGNAGPIFAVNGLGTRAPGGPYLTNWPAVMTSFHLFPLVAEGVTSSPAVGDFDGDGRAEALFQGNGASPLVLPADPGPQTAFGEPPARLPVVRNEDGSERRGLAPTSVFGEHSKAMRPDTMFPLFSQPSIGDLDQDGVPDVIASGASLSLAGALSGGSVAPKQAQHLLAAWSGKTGDMLPGMPFVIEDFSFLTNHAVADVNGDDYPEVITGTGVYMLHAVDACGREAQGWPKHTGGWIAAAPAVGDVDGDRNLDVVVGTRNGYLFAWKTPGKTDGVVQWESFHHDNANTGNIATPLEQGVTKRAARPLEAAACVPPQDPGDDILTAGGGCACSTAGEPTSPVSRALFGASLGAVGLALVRRRRRAS
jgi:MYXO-CTERM domain-containing protein